MVFKHFDITSALLFSSLGSSPGAHVTSGYVSRVKVEHRITKRGSGKKDDVGTSQRKTSKKKVMLELDLESSGRNYSSQKLWDEH